MLHGQIAWQETQERIRKRIREDLKEAVSAHSDYEENIIPKLKRAYLKKSQDAEVRSTRQASLQAYLTRFSRKCDLSLTLRRRRRRRFRRPLLTPIRL